MKTVQFLYPGTGAISEIGKGEAAGRKLNVPMPPYADDALFSGCGRCSKSSWSNISLNPYYCNAAPTASKVTRSPSYPILKKRMHMQQDD